MDRFGGKDSDGSGTRSPCSLDSFSRYSAFITYHVSGAGEIDMQETVTVPVLMEMKFQPGKCN